eukprot:428133-Amphidinium_carterae.1
MASSKSSAEGLISYIKTPRNSPKTKMPTKTRGEQYCTSGKPLGGVTGHVETCGEARPKGNVPPSATQ